MATKIVNRQPFSVDYDLDNINQGIFVMSEFHGICDNKNDVTIDQYSFAKAENVYVDVNNVLVSRPPFRLLSNDRFVIDEETLQGETFLWSSVVGYAGAGTGIYVNLLRNTDTENVIHCVAVGVDTEYEFNYSTDIIEIKAVWIEDRVFFFIGGQYFTFKDANDDYLLYDAGRWVYIPITNLVVNGIPTKVEDENYLTTAQRYRYLYSEISEIPDLSGALYVYQINDNDGEEYLYSVNADDYIRYRLLHPSYIIGKSGEFNLTGPYKFDAKIVNGVLILLRVNITTGEINVSYGTAIFHTVPTLYWSEYQYPVLTDDGLHIAQITPQGIAFCSLFATNSNTSQLEFVTNYTWEILPWHWPNDTVAPYDTFCAKFHTKDEWMCFGVIWVDGTQFVALVCKTLYKDEECYFRDQLTSGNFLYEYANIERPYNFDFYINNKSTSEHIISIKGGTAGAIDSTHYFAFVTFYLQNGGVLFAQLSGVVKPSENLTTADLSDVFGFVAHDFFDYDMAATDLAAIKIYPKAFIEANEVVSQSSIDLYTITIASATTEKRDAIVLRTLSYEIKAPEEGDFPVLYEAKLTTDKWEKTLVQNNSHYNVSVKFVFDENKNTLLTDKYLLLNMPNTFNDSTNEKAGYTIGFPSTRNMSGPNVPIAISGDTFYILNGEKLYTNNRTDGTILALDDYINVSGNDSSGYSIYIRNIVPEHVIQLGEYYLSIQDSQDNKYKLLVTDTRRDDYGNFLWYLPKSSIQVFEEHITALHPLSDKMIGIFTENYIWYIEALNLDNENVTRYTKAIRSKLPIGKRDGDDILTADNGQAILVPTQRGIAYLEPQDFVSTTDRTIKYITDNIQNQYTDFYFKEGRLYIDKDTICTVKSIVRSLTYSYWIIFYKYYQRDILLYDTRNGYWWKWTAPLPIIKMIGKDNLTAIFHSQGTRIEDSRHTDGGMRYLLCDLSYSKYEDYIYERRPIVEGVVDIESNGIKRTIIEYATGIIEWSFESQKLHFNAINNYKTVRSININTNGEGSLVTTYTTKCYRDMYHPEKSVVREIKINDLRTYVQRYQLMHLTNFSFGLSNYDNAELIDIVEPLSLNSVSIKYDVNGMVR